MVCFCVSVVHGGVGYRESSTASSSSYGDTSNFSFYFSAVEMAKC